MNYPNIKLMVALIGERPEEVTHFSRSVEGEVFSSNFDQRAEHQTKIAETCLERAKEISRKGGGRRDSDGFIDPFSPCL